MESKLFNKNDASRLAGLAHGTLDYHIKMGAVPAPTVSIGGRKYYTLDQVVAIVEHFRNKHSVTADGQYTPQEAADKLGFPVQRIYNNVPKIVQAKIGFRRGRRLIFTEDDLAKLKALLPKEHGDCGLKARLAMGYYSMSQAAKELKISFAVFMYHIYRNHIPRPTYQIGSYLCYNKADLDKLRDWFARNHQPNIKREYEE